MPKFASRFRRTTRCCASGEVGLSRGCLAHRCYDRRSVVEANTVPGAGGAFWLSDTEMAVWNVVKVVPRSEGTYGKFEKFSLIPQKRLRRVGGGGGARKFLRVGSVWL
jgi:hypothetical protein